MLTYDYEQYPEGSLIRAIRAEEGTTPQLDVILAHHKLDNVVTFLWDWITSYRIANGNIPDVENVLCHWHYILRTHRNDQVN